MRGLSRRAALVLAAVVAGLWSGNGLADGFTIGIAAPLSGPSARLGEQVKAGAEASAGAANPAIPLNIVDDQCNAEGGGAAARQFVEAKVTVVVGFLCTESIEAAMPILKEAGIPVITVGVRTNSLTDGKIKSGWPVYRMAPRADAEGAAVARFLVPLWRDQLFAIIDDGTIYGRELAETLRSEAEKEALQPVYVDTFRPQLENQIALAGRLRKAGATHVFVGGDLEDIAVLGRDAAGLDYQLTIAAGEALRSAASEVPLATGTLMVGLPEWADVATPAAVAAIKAKGVEAEGYSLPAYAAVEVAAGAHAGAQTASKPLAEAIGKGEFDTAIGKIAFDEKGDLRDNPYRLFRFDGTKFVEAGTQ
mgnify:CR=1 FL=1